MKPKMFDIKFDNTQGVFDAGSAVSGTVLLGLDQPMKIKVIKMVFTGRAHTRWVVKRGKSRITYAKEENYFHKILNLYEPESEGGRDHPIGNHAYPFSLQLPETLPSSFEGSKGHVRYSCKVTIERPWAFDLHVKRAFTVIHHLDLNNFPSAEIPVSDQASGEIYNCCCGQDGSVDINLQINKTGFVPGEPIKYTIAVKNQSSRTVNQVALILNQISTYTGLSNALFSNQNPKMYPKKRQFYLLYTREFCCKANTSRQIEKAIIVPSLPATGLEGCDIIDIKYNLEMKVLCSNSTISASKDVVIGTIPMRAASIRLTQETPSAPTHTDGLPTYEEVSAPPPSYAECVYGRTTIMDTTDDNNTSGDVSWAPVYPYYDWVAFSPQTFGNQTPDIVNTGQSQEDDSDND